MFELLGRDSASEPELKIVDAASRALMLNFTAEGESEGNFVNWYGMGAMNLSWSVGEDVTNFDASHEQVLALGHGGSTYGYTSQATYFPLLGFSLAVATNVEVDEGGIAAEVTCFAYHHVAAILRNVAPPACQFGATAWFGGYCSCRERPPGTLGPPPSPPPAAHWYSSEWSHLSFVGVGGVLVGLLCFPPLASFARWRRRRQGARECMADSLRLVEPLHATEPAEVLAGGGGCIQGVADTAEGRN